MDDELLDLVDDNDMVIGTVNRQDYNRMIEENLGYIRASELFILNSQGKIWVPIRTAHKTIAPGGYDYSAAGHVAAGETYLAAVLREAKEEANLDVSEKDIEFVTKMQSDNVKYFRAVFLIRSDNTPKLNPEDFVGGEWFNPEEVLRNLDAGHPEKINFRETVMALQGYLRHPKM